jgi:hypothetical protein
MSATPQPGANFVELDVREGEIPQPVVVERRAVFARSREPGRDGGVPMTEHAHRGGDIQPFSQSREHFTDALGRGLEPVQWRIPSRANGRITRLTTHCLDALMLPMGAVSH